MGVAQHLHGPLNNFHKAAVEHLSRSLVSVCKSCEISMAPEAAQAPDKEGCCRNRAVSGCPAVALFPGVGRRQDQVFGAGEGLIKAACLSIWAHVDCSRTLVVPA